MDVVSLAAEFPNDNPALHRGAIWVVTHPLAAPTAELPPEPEPVVAAPPAEPVAVVVEAFVAEAMSAGEMILAQETEEEIAPLTLLDPPDFVEAPSLLDELVAEHAAETEAEPVVVPSRPSGIIAIPPEARLDTFEIEDDDDEDDVLIEELEPLAEAILEEAPAPLASEVVLAAAAVNDVEASTSLPPPPDDPFTVLLYTLADVAVAAGSPHVASLLPALMLEGRLEDLPADAREALADGSMLEGDALSAGFTRTLEAWKAILRGTSDDFDATGGAMLDEWAAGLLARLLGTPAKSELLRRDLRSRGVAAFGLAA